MNQGTLYVIATPIGNRADMGERAISVLKQVDLIAAEDTRHSKILLQHYNIDSSMLAYHDHNEEQMTPKLIQRLLAGDNIALISDAGTPLLSDPGYRLVKTAHEESIKVSPIPGACAAIAALSVSGIATDRFMFAGFPPHKQGARQSFYQEFEHQAATLVFYESSHRIVASVKDMQLVFGAERKVVLAREITKLFETVHSSTLGELPEWLQADNNQQKGEFVLVVDGVEVQMSPQSAELEQVLKILLEELPVKQASKMAAKITGMKKNQVYKLALELSGK
ncbi:MAG: 16S rRNA (cytidine(1402)-2'-O)-methyltransferase [endosymbiont of Galathealinum brachiosum]|uniref:Ribosomal RNA small subunit methyltransferase I n=1 Tax=endosymbiont of Galathealinum brachiosum TaxID=2200906 RepID=A0A370D8X6_9GAMM|nr:MAG: 16S rRNA (cytidine(1402)-2'-O)-methyltransferase [endosymbiont of Galathealinum brachiosum]